MEEYIMDNYMLAVSKRGEKQLSCVARLCSGDMKIREEDG
jgi:hypothetical protein